MSGEDALAISAQAATPFELGVRLDLDARRPLRLGPLAAELHSRVADLGESVMQRYRERIEPWMADPGAPWEEIGRLTGEALRAELRAFRDGTWPDGCPEYALATARLLLTLGRSETLLGGYRIAHMVLWEAWFELVEASGRLPAERRELLIYGSDFLFRYADLLSEHLAAAYRSELAAHAPSSEQRRLRALREFLDGDLLAGSLLDFELDRHHLGLIAWGADSAPVTRALAHELGRPLLSVSPTEPALACWVWISGTRPLEPAQQCLLRAYEPVGTRIALGLEAFGPDGFRASHRQALRARSFARPAGRALIAYEDIAVEALACENEADARAFVAHELRGIEDDSARSRQIRETLNVYFASDSNAASTGAALSVHQQTVANRLRAAEQRLGHPSIGARRVELELALRLRECLSKPDPD